MCPPACSTPRRGHDLLRLGTVATHTWRSSHRRHEARRRPSSDPARRYLLNSTPIARPASAANASGFVQTALSKVTRRLGTSVLTRAPARRVTPDRVLSFLATNERTGHSGPSAGPMLALQSTLRCRRSHSVDENPKFDNSNGATHSRSSEGRRHKLVDAPCCDGMMIVVERWAAFSIEL